MQNKHSEYIRISEDKKTACLMVHGIVGSPRFFDSIIPLLPEDWSIYNILLDGHGGEVKDFANTSIFKWREQVGGYLSHLQKEYEEIYIFAHSMGTLISMEAVIERPFKIKKMFLFAIPLAPRVKIRSFINTTKSVLGIGKVEIDTLDAKNHFSITPERNVLKYIGFAPRYFEFLQSVKEMRKRIKLLYVPMEAFIHCKDELVSNKGEKYIRRNERIRIHFLENSYHNVFSEDFEKVKEVILDGIKKG